MRTKVDREEVGLLVNIIREFKLEVGILKVAALPRSGRAEYRLRPKRITPQTYCGPDVVRPRRVPAHARRYPFGWGR